METMELSPAARMAAAKRELEQATYSVTSEYRDVYRIEPAKYGSGVVIVGRNDGDGAPQMQFDEDQAAWLAQQLIRIFNLEVTLRADDGFAIVSKR